MLDEQAEHGKLMSRADFAIAEARRLADAVAAHRAMAGRELERVIERATFGPKSRKLFGLEPPPDGQQREDWREELLRIEDAPNGSSPERAFPSPRS